MNAQTKNSRRKFLGTLALGASTGLAAMATPFKFNSFPSIPNEKDLDNWFKSIKGNHRVVFDGAEPNHALPIIWTWGFYMTNNQTGSPDSELTAMCVFRHNAIPFGLEDRIWKKYKLGEVFKINDNKTNAPSTRNPYFDAKDGDFPMNGIDGIKRMIERGAMFCVCNLAISFYSGKIAQSMGLDPEEVRKDWVSGVLPGVQVVPAGIWALERAQKQGCSYIFAG